MLGRENLNTFLIVLSLLLVLSSWLPLVVDLDLVVEDILTFKGGTIDSQILCFTNKF